MLAITHYNRLLDELRPDLVHVLVKGRIVATGGPELADELEDTGYAGYGAEEAEAAGVVDPFADPFADPFGSPGRSGDRRPLRRPRLDRVERPAAR